MESFLIKKSFFKSAGKLGIYGLTKRMNSGAIALFYHGIESEINDPKIQKLHLTFSIFEKQIYYLLNNFEIISIDYLYDCLKYNYKISPSQALITFDDGYKNIVNLVAPFLKSLKIPFSVFINTNPIMNKLRLPTFLLRAAIYYSGLNKLSVPSINKNFDISSDKKKNYSKNILANYIKSSPQTEVNNILNDLIQSSPKEKWTEINGIFSSDELMNWEDVKQLHEMGVTIGSHCHDHFILHSNQNIVAINNQLKVSRGLIMNALGECKYFAYPNGKINDFTPEAVLAVEQNGYSLGFTTLRGEIYNNSNRFVLPRWGAPKDLDHFKFIVNTRFYYRIREVVPVSTKRS